MGGRESKKLSIWFFLINDGLVERIIFGISVILCMKGGVFLANENIRSFKGRVMQEKGYDVNKSNPDKVKFEVAKEQGVPLKEGYNGQLTSEEAGKVGGPIGGNMVKEMIKMAQEQMKQQGRK